MSWWTKNTKRQRGWVKAHVAKDNGRVARRQEDDRMIQEQIEDANDD